MKRFCIAGPVDPTIHYYVGNRIDDDYINNLIGERQYFVLHAPRQSGKTTAIEAFICDMNDSGEYHALYINIEAAQAARENVQNALIVIVELVARKISSKKNFAYYQGSACCC